MSWFVPKSGGESRDSQPGIYLARIANVTVKTGRDSGDQYGNVMLADAKTNQILCYDVFMLEGPGAGIGVAKASKFGLTRPARGEIDGEMKEGDEIVDLEDWIGAEAVVKVVENDEWNRLEPDEDWGRFGYAPASEWEELKELAFGGEDEPVDPSVPF